VLYVFFKTPRLRSVTSYYIVTLAVSDVLMVVIVMPISIAISIRGCDMTLPSFIPSMIAWINSTLILGSLQTTTLISINRYLCVVKQEWYRKYFKPKSAILMIAICWLFTTLLCILLFFTTNMNVRCNLHFLLYITIIYDLKTLAIYIHIYQFVFIFLPSVINIICHWKIYKYVRNHTIQATDSLQSNTEQRGLSRDEAHLTRSMMTLVLGFSLCWIPNSIIHQLLIHFPLEVTSKLAVIITFLTFFSSALNPVLYNIFNRPFRKRFHELLRMRPFSATHRRQAVAPTLNH